MKKLPIIFLVIVLIGFASCHRSNYDERVVIPNGKWEQAERATFDVAMDDTINGYAFRLNLRHEENYRYSNLFLFLHTQMPNGNLTHDTIELVLAQPDGEWVGKSSGSLRNVSILLNQNLRFPLKGTYHFEIEQAMREPELKGITDIGIQLNKK